MPDYIYLGIDLLGSMAHANEYGLQHKEDAKPDIVAEIGIAFLLAGLEDDPVVLKTRQFIQAAVDKERGMLPSTSGDFNLSLGEYRNVLAIMLLDWRSVNPAPRASKHSKVFADLPYGLIQKAPNPLKGQG